METMQYKGFLGSIEISKEDKILFGKLLHINGLVTYEAETYPELESAFQEAVEDYLDDCEKRNIEPQKSCSGTFNIRITPEKHKKLTFLASLSESSLNSLMNEAVDLVIEKHTTKHAKLLANKVFELNWNNNEQFRSNMTQWTMEKLSSEASIKQKGVR